MATGKATPALLLGGALALVLLSRKKAEDREGRAYGRHDADDDWDDDWDDEEEEPPIEAEKSYEDLVEEWKDEDGRAMLGHFYQAKSGDNLLTIAREALFGSREPRAEPWERQAVIDLSIRIDCSPWNQAAYGKGPEELEPGHHAVENGWAQVGVAISPSYQCNRHRLARGEKPTSASGDHYPYIWIPMINLDVFEMERSVTTLGQNYPDDGNGEYSMINPPPWVVDMGLAQVASTHVGCALPEGDFRKRMEAR